MTEAILPAKIDVGISMLAEVRDGEFDSAQSILVKILSNVLANPSEEKFRKLRSSNNKIAALLATRGVRALLRGAGFEEEGEFLVLAPATATHGVQDALSKLEQQAQQRVAAVEAAKAEALAQRKSSVDDENEKRKLMRMQIEDDAAARKEPGWTAKAAGVKGGKAITSCADVGAQGGGG